MRNRQKRWGSKELADREDSKGRGSGGRGGEAGGRRVDGDRKGEPIGRVGGSVRREGRASGSRG